MSLFLVFGAAATQTWTETGAGGLTTAGAASVTHHFVKAYTGAGGAASGGIASVTHHFVKTYVGVGGLASGGTAGAAHHFAKGYVGAGGAMSGGTAAVTHHFVKRYVANGGAAFGGVASHSFLAAGTQVWTYVGSGGLAVSGAATKAFVSAALPDGGGGIIRMPRAWLYLPQKQEKPIELLTYRYRASGGISVGGRASVAVLNVNVYRFDVVHRRSLGGTAQVAIDNRFRRIAARDLDDLELLAA